MTQFLDIFGFLAVVLRGLTLAFEALTVGGVIFWALAASLPSAPGACRSIQSWLIRFSMLLAVTQICVVAANSVILVASTDIGWGGVVGASFWIAGGLVIIGSASVALFSKTWSAGPILLVSCMLILAGGVMQSHAVARLDHRGILVALTLVHHLGAAAWIGGIFYLLIVLRHSLGSAAAATLVRRFSKTAMISVAALVVAGVTLSFFYIGSVPALGGTTYGIMVLAKTTLTMLLLGLGALNFRIVRGVNKCVAQELLPLRRFAEAELGIGLTVLLAAASLTSTPPAIDVVLERVNAQDIAARMRPQWPRMETPPLSSLSPATSLAPPRDAIESSFVPGQKRSPETPADIAWSEYNHHWAGVVVLATGILALLSRRFLWARHWPLAFLALAVFLLIRADSENWPLGSRGFWESFRVAEVAQHRLFVLLIVAFGIFEWAVQNHRIACAWPSLVFPLVCAAGGALLMTHSHSLGNVRKEFLAELSHIPLALMAVLAGWSRWLEIRLPPHRASRAMRIWPAYFVLIGLTLLNYRES